MVELISFTLILCIIDTYRDPIEDFFNVKSLAREKRAQEKNNV